MELINKYPLVLVLAVASGTDPHKECYFNIRLIPSKDKDVILMVQEIVNKYYKEFIEHGNDDLSLVTYYENTRKWVLEHLPHVILKCIQNIQNDKCQWDENQEYDLQDYTMKTCLPVPYVAFDGLDLIFDYVTTYDFSYLLGVEEFNQDGSLHLDMYGH